MDKTEDSVDARLDRMEQLLRRHIELHPTTPTENVRPKTSLALNRMISLTDGVFGVVLTLLVLELKLPETTQSTDEGKLLSALINNWPKVLAHFTAFLAGSILWSGHHIFSMILVRSSQTFVWIQILYLFFLGLLPFSCTLLGDHIENRIAGLIFVGNLFAVCTTCSVMWAYACKNNRLIIPNISPEIATFLNVLNIMGSIIFCMLFIIIFAGLPPVKVLISSYLIGALFIAYELVGPSKALHEQTDGSSLDAIQAHPAQHEAQPQSVDTNRAPEPRIALLMAEEADAGV